MIALLVGFSIVAVGAIGCGLALFRNHPVPRSASTTRSSTSRALPTENQPRSSPRRRSPDDAFRKGRLRRLPEPDIRVSRRQRLTSGILLALFTFGSAVIIGGLISVVLVVAVLIIT